MSNPTPTPSPPMASKVGPPPPPPQVAEKQSPDFGKEDSQKSKDSSNDSAPGFGITRAVSKWAGELTGGQTSTKSQQNVNESSNQSNLVKAAAAMEGTSQQTQSQQQQAQGVPFGAQTSITSSLSSGSTNVALQSAVKNSMLNSTKITDRETFLQEANQEVQKVLTAPKNTNPARSSATLSKENALVTEIKAGMKDPSLQNSPRASDTTSLTPALKTSTTRNSAGTDPASGPGPASVPGPSSSTQQQTSNAQPQQQAKAAAADGPQLSAAQRFAAKAAKMGIGMDPNAKEEDQYGYGNLGAINDEAQGQGSQSKQTQQPQSQGADTYSNTQTNTRISVSSNSQSQSQLQQQQAQPQAQATPQQGNRNSVNDRQTSVARQQSELDRNAALISEIAAKAPPPKSQQPAAIVPTLPIAPKSSMTNTNLESQQTSNVPVPGPGSSSGRPMGGAAYTTQSSRNSNTQANFNGNPNSTATGVRLSQSGSQLSQSQSLSQSNSQIQSIAQGFGSSTSVSQITPPQPYSGVVLDSSISQKRNSQQFVQAVTPQGSQQYFGFNNSNSNSIGPQTPLQSQQIGYKQVGQGNDSYRSTPQGLGTQQQPSQMSISPIQQAIWQQQTAQSEAIALNLERRMDQLQQSITNRQQEASKKPDMTSANLSPQLKGLIDHVMAYGEPQRSPTQTEINQLYQHQSAALSQSQQALQNSMNLSNQVANQVQTLPVSANPGPTDPNQIHLQQNIQNQILQLQNQQAQLQQLQQQQQQALMNQQSQHQILQNQSTLQLPPIGPGPGTVTNSISTNPIQQNQIQQDPSLPKGVSILPTGQISLPPGAIVLPPGLSIVGQTALSPKQTVMQESRIEKSQSPDRHKSDIMNQSLSGQGGVPTPSAREKLDTSKFPSNLANLAEQQQNQKFLALARDEKLRAMQTHMQSKTRNLMRSIDKLQRENQELKKNSQDHKRTAQFRKLEEELGRQDAIIQGFINKVGAKEGRKFIEDLLSSGPPRTKVMSRVELLFQTDDLKRSKSSYESEKRKLEDALKRSENELLRQRQITIRLEEQMTDAVSDLQEVQAQKSNMKREVSEIEIRLCKEYEETIKLLASELEVEKIRNEQLEIQVGEEKRQQELLEQVQKFSESRRKMDELEEDIVSYRQETTETRRQRDWLHNECMNMANELEVTQQETKVLGDQLKEARERLVALESSQQNQVNLGPGPQSVESQEQLKSSKESNTEAGRTGPESESKDASALQSEAKSSSMKQAMEHAQKILAEKDKKLNQATIELEQWEKERVTVIEKFDQMLLLVNKIQEKSTPRTGRAIQDLCFRVASGVDGINSSLVIDGEMSLSNISNKNLKNQNTTGDVDMSTSPANIAGVTVTTDYSSPLHTARQLILGTNSNDSDAKPLESYAVKYEFRIKKQEREIEILKEEIAVLAGHIGGSDLEEAVRDKEKAIKKLNDRIKELEESKKLDERIRNEAKAQGGPTPTSSQDLDLLTVSQQLVSQDLGKITDPNILKTKSSEELTTVIVDLRSELKRTKEDLTLLFDENTALEEELVKAESEIKSLKQSVRMLKTLVDNKNKKSDTITNSITIANTKSESKDISKTPSIGRTPLNSDSDRKVSKQNDQNLNNNSAQVNQNQNLDTSAKSLTASQRSGASSVTAASPRVDSHPFVTTTSEAGAAADSKSKPQIREAVGTKGAAANPDIDGSKESINATTKVAKKADTVTTSDTVNQGQAATVVTNTTVVTANSESAAAATQPITVTGPAEIQTVTDSKQASSKEYVQAPNVTTVTSTVTGPGPIVAATTATTEAATGDNKSKSEMQTVTQTGTNNSITTVTESATAQQQAAPVTTDVNVNISAPTSQEPAVAVVSSTVTAENSTTGPSVTAKAAAVTVTSNTTTPRPQVTSGGPTAAANDPNTVNTATLVSNTSAK